MLFILNRQEKVVGVLKNSGKNSVPFFNDLLTEDLATGSETFEFTTVSRNGVGQHLVVGNFIAFKKGKSYKLFQIMQTEEDHQDELYITVYAECAGLQLINSVFRGVKIVSASFERVMQTLLSDTSWNVGILPYGLATTYDLDIEQASVYSLLQTYAQQYGVELEFRVELNRGKISKKYIDGYYNRGKVTGKRFTYERDIEGIVRKTDATELYTALIGRGNNEISFKDVTVDGIDKPMGQDFVANQSAYEKYNNNGYHIVGLYECDTDDAKDLLRKTHKRLLEVSEPKVEYDISVLLLCELLGEKWNEVAIGDTISVFDNAFYPPIMVSARVSKLQTSMTDKNANKCTLANFIEVKSNITSEMRKIASQLQLTAQQLRLDFSTSGGNNLVKNSMVKETSNAYGFATRRVDTSLMVAGKKYTLTFRGRTVNGAGGKCLRVYIYTPDWSFEMTQAIPETSLTTKSMTFVATADMISKGLVISSYHFPKEGDRSGSSYIEWYCVTEGEYASNWTSYHGEIYNGNTMIDADGVTVNNGAIIVKNKAGNTVLSGDSNGNLTLSGTIKSETGNGQYVALNSGGITFRDSQKNEEILRIGTSFSEGNRDINGVTFAMPQYSDRISFRHIQKPSLENGWSSSDTAYGFMEMWSNDYTGSNGTKNYKGVNVFAPMYLSQKIRFRNGGDQYLHEVTPNITWNNMDKLMGVYGDNGTVIGYKSDDNLQARIVVTEQNHPNTEDAIKSWGNWNCSGATVRNATFSGKFVNSYANPVTRTFSETSSIMTEGNQVRVNFENIQIKNGKAILNIPKKYSGINEGYTIASIVKKGMGDVWVSEEEEERFIIEAENDIKINIEIIIKLTDMAVARTLKHEDATCYEVPNKQTESDCC